MDNEDKNGQRRGQKWTTKRTKMDNEDKNGQRRRQKWTTKRSKVDTIKKDTIEKEMLEKETPVYISSSQDTETVRVASWEAEVLPPAWSEEEETDSFVHSTPTPPAQSRLWKGTSAGSG